MQLILSDFAFNPIVAHEKAMSPIILTNYNFWKKP